MIEKLIEYSIRNRFIVLTIAAAMTVWGAYAVVNTPVGAIPMQVTDGRNGFLVTPGDTDALAEKLTYLLQNPATARRFGAYGRKRSEHGFSWQELSVKTHQALLDALHDTNAGVTK